MTRAEVGKIKPSEPVLPHLVGTERHETGGFAPSRTLMPTRAGGGTPLPKPGTPRDVGDFKTFMSRPTRGSEDPLRGAPRLRPKIRGSKVGEPQPIRGGTPQQRSHRQWDVAWHRQTSPEAQRRVRSGEIKAQDRKDAEEKARGSAPLTP